MSAPSLPVMPVPTLAAALLLQGEPHLGRSSAHLDRSWWSWAGPQGGLLAALALRAASALAGDRAPRSLSAQFLRPLPEGPVGLRAQVVREGGTSSTVTSALLAADGLPALTATLTSGRARGGGTPYAAVPPPTAPAPQDCEPLELPRDLVPFGQHLEVRPADWRLPFGGGGVAVLTAWVRLRSQEPAGAAALTVLADAMPPALYGAVRVPVAVPTVDLQVSYASGLDEAPVAGWLLARIATRSAQDGWCVDDSEVWGPDGRLLVQARQTRRVLGDLDLGEPA